MSSKKPNGKDCRAVRREASVASSRASARAARASCPLHPRALPLVAASRAKVMRASAALRGEAVAVGSGVPPLNSIHEPNIKIWDDARLKIRADMEKIGKGRRRPES